MAENPYVNKVNLADGTVLIDISTDTVTAGKMLSGTVAHDKSGAEITGTIPSKSGSDITVSGDTVSVPAGYYASAESKAVDTGNYSASVSSHSITTTPVVTGGQGGTGPRICTTTQPSGTDGTDYWSFTPSGTVTTTGVSTAKGKATIGTAGYIGTGNKESSASTVNITPTVTSGTTWYVVKGTITNNTYGGTSSGTVNRGNQIKIGAGYYPADLYYTAQSNSGTITLTESGTHSVDGYQYATVPENCLVISVTATSSTSKTINNSAITTSHYVFNTASSVAAADLSWSTAAGSLTLSCSGGIPAMTVFLCKQL